LRDLTNFELDFQLAQRKLVELGQVVSRIYSMQLVAEMAEKGFNKDLTENALDVLRQEVASLINNLRFENKTVVVENYGDKSYWFDL